MPYIGAKVRTQKYTVSLKAYKSSDETVDFENIRATLETTVRAYDGSDDLTNVGDFIATCVEPSMFLDHKVPFYEVEVLTPQGHWYIVSREDKELF